MTPPLPQEKFCLTLQQIEERLLNSKVSPTAHRIAIYQYILCESDHPTADDVKLWTDVNFPKLSRATVYNTLDLFVKAGLLRELTFSHTDKVVYDKNTCAHSHFYDEGTGRLYDLMEPQCVVSLDLPHDVQVSGFELCVRGRLKP
jgi:Fur family iron response transcriptional regulator